MHWSSEWAEQHYDVSSTTSPPAHPKPLLYPQPRPGFSGYSDDISAFSASTLLKRYAERYTFSTAYLEPGTFRRSEPLQDAWSMGYSSEGLPGLEGVKGSFGSASNLSEQFSSGAISQDYMSTYSSPHLYPKPTYLPQSAFALPHSYPPPAPGNAYTPSLTAPSSPSLLHSGIHTPTPLSSSLPSNHGVQHLKCLEEFQELPRNRKFGFEQPKTARVSAYEVRDNNDQHISNGIGNISTDIQNFRPPLQPNLKVEQERKTSHLQPLETPSYGGSDQYSYH